MSQEFDVVVIGGGPGGYAAAIRCAQRGASVGLVEKAEMGGTCLNRGCIPSKALLGSAHFLNLFKEASAMGVEVGDVRPDWAKMQARKDAIVLRFQKGIAGLVRSYGIQILQGRGIVTGPGRIQVLSDTEQTEFQAKRIILATGSESIEIPAFPFDGNTIISSTEALSLSQVPASMVIIGGGVIGCELACVYAAIGTKVTIVEALSQLLPNEDTWVGTVLAREFRKQQIESLISQKVTGVQVHGDAATVSLESGQSLEAEKVLVAVGRRAVCDKETVDNLSLEMNRWLIKVNEKMETNVPGVYAIGDAVGTTYLAHGAFAEAEVAAVNATGGDEKMGDYSLVPRAVYSFPEVGSVGRNEARCTAAGIDTVVGKANFRSNGRSAGHNEQTGEVRVIRDKKTNTIQGVTMVGASVTEMVATARALIGSKEQITEISFAHPTVSEVLKEAWEDAFGISLHGPPKKK